MIRTLITCAVTLLACVPAVAQHAGHTSPYAEDMRALIDAIERQYAYLDRHPIDLDGLREYAIERSSRCESRHGFVGALEGTLANLCDDHATLNTNTGTSPRLVPSGVDIWTAWEDGELIIESVREGSAADEAGLRAGVTIGSIRGEPADRAVRSRAPVFVDGAHPVVLDWAARAVVAERRDTPISMSVDGREMTYTPAPPSRDGLLEALELEGGLGYIRINDSLGDSNLIEHPGTEVGKERSPRQEHPRWKPALPLLPLTETHIGFAGGLPAILNEMQKVNS